jgi:hypothetical protein
VVGTAPTSAGLFAEVLTSRGITTIICGLIPLFVCVIILYTIGKGKT